MQIIRYEYRDEVGWGILEAGGITRIEGDPVGDYRRSAQELDARLVRLLPPIKPGKIIGIGLNYAAHAAESGKLLPAEPLMFLKPASALIGAGEPIVLPHRDHRTDHEAELAIVIGRRVRNLAANDWRDVVLGFTCANDVSDRVLQKRDGQFTRGKGFDTFCPLGPVLETEFDPTDVAIRCRVNGELRQDSRTRDLIFDIPTLVAFVSRVMTLETYDVILTGTPEGVGPLAPGDLVEVEVEGIGTLANPVR
jgi:2-keto-4-pentenoate hydratase/2-oxohepta-3-ene-1,7-dioic acid hydratase in catechol pathway